MPATAGSFTTNREEPRKELPGHIVNRLQSALWREAYHLVAEGYISAAELDLAVSSGPGIRWALVGPFGTQHLSGGAGGFAHLTKHFGARTGLMWSRLGNPEYTPEFAQQVVDSVEQEFKGTDIGDITVRRDAALMELLELKNRHRLDDIPNLGLTEEGA